MDHILPHIDLTRCTGCGLCVRHCSPQAVEMQDHIPVIVRPSMCVYCGECEEVCPVGAIALEYEIAPLTLDPQDIKPTRLGG